MVSAIKRISAGSNCFLVKTDSGFVLIDSGVASKRAALERGMVGAGCETGDLRLVVLTHGDSDHADNCAYLREKYGVEIAMHPDDVGMVERGDMAWNRKAKMDRITAMGRVIMLVGKLMLLVRPQTFDTFPPDICVEDGQSLSPYGLDATILHLPGHSKGSIGVLTSEGDLFCGDLIYNFMKPNQVLIDDLAAARASVERLKALNVRTVYPGHGKPFPWGEFAKRHG
ncbi:MAG: MBL fold metallo-hydrolase [Thermoleophilia bacterium]